MELNRKHFHAIIFYGKFNRGRRSVQDEFREGHPKSVVVPETIDAVSKLILQDRHGPIVSLRQP